MYQCVAEPGYEVFVESVLPWLDIAWYCLLPFGIILVTNLCIIKRILTARSASQMLLSAEASSVLGRASFPRSVLMRKPQRSVTESNRKVTVMLVAVAITFILLTLPMSTYQLYMDNSAINPGCRDYAVIMLVRVICSFLMYSNHCVNVLLFYATGRRFRMEVKNLFFRCRDACFNWDWSNSVSDMPGCNNKDHREGMELEVFAPKPPASSPVRLRTFPEYSRSISPKSSRSPNAGNNSSTLRER